MRIVAALFLLAAAFYVLAEAKRDDLEPARQVPGRRFKVRPLRHSRQYYERMLGLLPGKNELPLRGNAYFSIERAFANVTPPASFNWVEQPDIVTPVKYQGGCGSCYAFASAAAIESMEAIWNGKAPMDLSEQQIVDCSTPHGNKGCGGGALIYAYKYVEASQGLKLESAYSYTATTGSCSNPAGTVYGTDITYASMPLGDENALKKVLYTMGPISIGLSSGQETFYGYARGIYDDPACSSNPTGINHGVLLVGYGEENGTPYWIIKNSWGSWWGENGYMRILRGKGMCRIGGLGSMPVPRWLFNSLVAGIDVHHGYR